MRIFSRNLLRLVLPISFALGGLAACTATRPQKMRLHVGEIKEITRRTPTDTSRRLLATSENPEVADVSRQQAVAEGVTPSAAPAARQTFLLKGVTADRVRVVFSEKTKTLQAQDWIRKTYLVEVVNE